MSWRREGYCCNCGECCLTLVDTWYMSGYPEDGERKKGCIYLEEQDDGTYLCLIMSRDIEWDSLDDKVKKYFEDNCRTYPNPEDPGHTPPRHKLLETCTYRMVSVDE